MMHLNNNEYEYDYDGKLVRGSKFDPRRLGPLLHVPITKYKIIPNPNPNPNTKMTVNTTPKQM